MQNAETEKDKLPEKEFRRKYKINFVDLPLS
jgi:hypothetical protein